MHIYKLCHFLSSFLLWEYLVGFNSSSTISRCLFNQRGNDCQNYRLLHEIHSLVSFNVLKFVISSLSIGYAKHPKLLKTHHTVRSATKYQPITAAIESNTQSYRHMMTFLDMHHNSDSLPLLSRTSSLPSSH